jgi:hypothetical protein
MFEQNHTNICVASEKATEAGNEAFSRIIGKVGMDSQKARKYFYWFTALQVAIVTCSVEIVKPQPFSEKRSSGEGDRSDDSKYVFIST